MGIYSRKTPSISTRPVPCCAVFIQHYIASDYIKTVSEIDEVGISGHCWYGLEKRHGNIRRCLERMVVDTAVHVGVVPKSLCPYGGGASCGQEQVQV
jgi:hypothetical protein